MFNASLPFFPLSLSLLENLDNIRLFDRKSHRKRKINTRIWKLDFSSSTNCQVAGEDCRQLLFVAVKWWPFYESATDEIENFSSL